jgi:hypothetical protein
VVLAVRSVRRWARLNVERAEQAAMTTLIMTARISWRDPFDHVLGAMQDAGSHGSSSLSANKLNHFARSVWNAPAPDRDSFLLQLCPVT